MLSKYMTLAQISRAVGASTTFWPITGLRIHPYSHFCPAWKSRWARRIKKAARLSISAQRTCWIKDRTRFARLLLIRALQTRRRQILHQVESEPAHLISWHGLLILMATSRPTKTARMSDGGSETESINGGFELRRFGRRCKLLKPCAHSVFEA